MVVEPRRPPAFWAGESPGPRLATPGGGSCVGDLASKAVRTRLATDSDAEAIRAIYNVEVLGSNVTFDLVPRTHEDQLAWLADHKGAYPAIVAVDDDDVVVGFASVSPYRSRPAYSTSVEDSVYIHSGCRGQGVGRLLLSDLVALSGAHGFHAIMARIVGGHEASIALHRSCGFEPVGVEREVGRKFSRWQDVAVMQRLL
jgi:L-amino acid N-acyltransferase